MCMQRSRRNTNNFGLYPWNGSTHDPSEMMPLASGPFSSAFRHICVCGCCLAWKLDSQTHFCIGFLSDVDIGPTGTDCLLVANWSSMFLSQQRCSEASGKKSGTTVQPTLPLEIHFESLFPLNRDSSSQFMSLGVVKTWWTDDGVLLLFLSQWNDGWLTAISGRGNITDNPGQFFPPAGVKERVFSQERQRVLIGSCRDYVCLTRQPVVTWGDTA